MASADWIENNEMTTADQPTSWPMNSIPRRDFALELSNWKKFPKLPAMPRRLRKRITVEEPRRSLEEVVHH